MYDFTLDLIKVAGEQLESRKKEAFSVSSKNNDPKNIVTSLDVEMGKFITERILAEYPDHSIHNEEAKAIVGDNYQWVIDPIDGSAVFSRGIPHYAISIGVLKDGVPVVGAVLDPMTRELFSFEQGKGAFLNGEPIQVSTQTELAPCFVLLAAGRKEDQREWAGESYKRLLGAVNKTKNFGSSALSLCYIAAGRIEGMVAGTLTTKDVAAAIGILNEAGGVITNAAGVPALFLSTPQRIYAANNEVVATQLRELLESE